MNNPPATDLYAGLEVPNTGDDNLSTSAKIGTEFATRQRVGA
jgi:hypothetical protein